jgi:ribosomal protein L15
MIVLAFGISNPASIIVVATKTSKSIDFKFFSEAMICSLSWLIPTYSTLFKLLNPILGKRGFEGGQMPLQRRIPKRGFNNIFAKAVAAVNLSTLNRKFEDGATVDIEALVNAGVVKNGFDAVKILGNGKLDKKLTVKVSAFSESAKAAIEAAGGKAEVI